MPILRAKTANLFSYGLLTEKQELNVQVNTREMLEERPCMESTPQRLVLELTNSCNISCIMCGRNAKKFKPTFFEWEWLERLSPVLDRVTEVTLFGWGEPTVHPKFRQILEYLARFPVKKYILTNGMRLDRFEDLVVETVDVMAVSLDGAEAATNDRIRRGASYNRIVENLRSVVAKRAASSRRKPHINFVMTLMRDNLHELPGLVEIAHRIGIEEVKAVYLTSFSQELASQVLWDRTAEVKAAFEQASDLSQRLGILLKLPHVQGEDPAGDARHRPCYVGWRDCFLGSDGIVRPCQSTAQKIMAFHSGTDFWSMWNSPEYQSFRKAVNHEGMMPAQCRFCYQSSFANWNRRTSFLQNEGSREFAPEWQ
jgi:MoaA/NifB/PqqE/SkfB family radical SAM enzyme